jgi:hypothetical protein
MESGKREENTNLLHMTKLSQFAIIYMQLNFIETQTTIGVLL